MKMYDNKGYLDFHKVLINGATFTWIVGGRGTGKTFGALKAILESGKKFIYLRNLKSQIEVVGSNTFSPFKPLNDMFGYNIITDTAIKSIKGFYDDTNGEKTLIGLACALSSFSSLRGFDASDYDYILFDEFIPKPDEVIRGNYGVQFIDFYETVSRNRELQGKEPLKVIGTANSNNIGNAIFIEFGLLNKVLQMIKKGKTYSKIEEKETALFFLKDSPISKQKANTALYKAISSDYSEMALSNIFAQVDNRNVKSLEFNQLRPLIQVKELYIYYHNDGIYISNHGFMKMPSVTIDNFKKSYRDICLAILFDRVLYENTESKIITQAYI